MNTRPHHQILFPVPAALQLNRYTLLLVELSPLLIPLGHLVLHIGVLGTMASTDPRLKPLVGRAAQGRRFLECSEGEGRVGGGRFAVARVSRKRNVGVMEIGRTDDIPPVVVAKDAPEFDMMMLFGYSGWVGWVLF